MQAPRPLRPVVFDYDSPVDFLKDLLDYHRQSKRHFSLRQRSVPGCSPSLISQVLQGKRSLTLKQLPAFSEVFALNNMEQSFIREKLTPTIDKSFVEKPQNKRRPKNHILNDWLNIYVKDTVDLAGFSPNPQSIFHLLGGLVPPKRIEKSIKFLLSEGFWRKNPKGEVVADEAIVVSSDGVADGRIRRLHKKALEIAKQGIDKYGIDRRVANTFLVSLDDSELEELRLILKKFQAEILDFIEEKGKGRQNLVQINLNLTPIGGKNYE